MRSTVYASALRYACIAAGIILSAISLTLFLQPLDIAPPGLAGAATMLNELFDTPVGLVMFLLNIPIMLLARRLLPDGARVVMRSIVAIVGFSLVVDILAPIVPPEGLSDDRMLSAIFGGITCGIGVGLVYRAGATFGGNTTLALVLQRRFSLPMSTTFLGCDTLIVIAAGLVYGWEGALYSVVTLFIMGLASDYVLEGPSVIRTAVIITDKPQAIVERVHGNLNRGVSSWKITGEYTGAERTMLYISIARPQVRDLKDELSQVDPEAFMVIGMGHAAYGAGFRRMKRPRM